MWSLLAFLHLPIEWSASSAIRLMLHIDRHRLPILQRDRIDRDVAWNAPTEIPVLIRKHYPSGTILTVGKTDPADTIVAREIDLYGAFCRIEREQPQTLVSTRHQ
jgi:hypothetical protein